MSSISKSLYLVFCKLFLNLKVKGEENFNELKSNGVLFVSNYHSLADQKIIEASIPKVYSQKLKRLVDSKTMNIKEDIELLKKGNGFIVFSQDEPSKYFNPKEARPEIIKLAKESDCQIMPVFIKNSHKIKLKDILSKTRQVEVVFGKPFYYRDLLSSGLKEGSDHDLSLKVFERIKQLVKFPPVKKEFTYLDVLNRDVFLKNEDVQYLFSVVPKEIKENLEKSYLSLQKSNTKKIFKYFVKESKAFQHIVSFPGSFEAFEYLYLERKAETPIDKYFLKCKSGIQTNQRLLSLDENLPIWINKLYKGKTLLIDSFFSGPGRDLIRVLKNNPDLKNKVSIRNIDIDKKAVEVGREAARKEDLQDVITYLGHSFDKTKPRKADLIILVGVLCPLELHVSERMLRIMKRYASQDGYIIYSTAQRSLLEDDPFMDFLMRSANWSMSYKTDKEAWDLAEESGWEAVSQFFDEPLHHHCMTVAKNIL